MDRHRSFAPIVDRATRLLVLGSLPGAASLAQQRYYAHPRNHFWPLIGAVIGMDLVALDYEERLSALLAHRVGLWDVVAEAHRPGSLDSAIRGHAANDLAALVARLPHLRAIGFNGATAAKIGTKQLGGVAAELKLIRLPSSSPAYTLPFAAKRDTWMRLREALEQ